MSIPLDRLYNYLDSLSPDNIIIYRWSPHGSKKIQDLTMYKNYFKRSNEYTIPELVNLHTKPMMIFHDQEPLFYNHYSTIDFIANLELWCSHTPIKSDLFVSTFEKLHLRAQLGVLNVFDYTLLCHSEKNTDQLKLYEDNYFIGVYYWSHALIARDWFRFAEHDKTLQPDFDKINKDFLIYNRSWSGTREYRLTFTEMLIDNNLTALCNVKFNPVDSNTHYTDHVFKNTKLQIESQNIESVLTENTSESWASADYNNEDYTQSAIEVVLETLFDDTRQHLTEKILRPIACGRPFILVSTPGCLQYLKDYGFKTFDGLINEEYDTIQDPVERLHAIVKEMKRISELDHSSKIDLWNKLYQIAGHNKQLFFSNDFHSYIVTEFTDNLSQGLDKCYQHVGKWWHLFKSLDGFQDTEFTKEIDKFLNNYDASNF